MQFIWLYLITAVVFFSLDMIGIRFIIRPVFERNIGDLFASPLRLAPAAVFYLFYVAGLLWFVSLPALRAGAPLQALIGGMLFGALCYGTYEFTNYATLARWSLSQVITDLIWGICLTGIASWAGVAIMTTKLE